MVDFTDPGTLGVTLMAVGVVMFLLEAMLPGFFIAVPATILTILGIVAYNTPPEGMTVFLRFAPLVVVAVGVPATAITIYVYRRMAPPADKPTTRSADTLVGSTAKVTRAVDSESLKGKVRLGRETWSATSLAGPIPTGATVRVVRVDGVILFVEPAE